MINLAEDFKRLIELDKIIKEDEKHHLQLITERNEYFKRITLELNNHREELREEYGLKDYNYATICSFENGDGIDDMEHYFKVKFNREPTAKMLSVIEEITGCYYSPNTKEHGFYYFKLPEIIRYSTSWSI